MADIRLWPNRRPSSGSQSTSNPRWLHLVWAVVAIATKRIVNLVTDAGRTFCWRICHRILTLASRMQLGLSRRPQLPRCPPPGGCQHATLDLRPSFCRWVAAVSARGPLAGPPTARAGGGGGAWRLTGVLPRPAPDRHARAGGEALSRAAPARRRRAPRAPPAAVPASSILYPDGRRHRVPRRARVFFLFFFCAWPGRVGTDRPTQPPGRGPPPRWWCGQRRRRVVRATAVTPLDDCRRHPARLLARAGRWPLPSNRRPLPPRGAPLPRRAVRRPVGDRLSSSRANATASPAPRTSSPPAFRCGDLVCLSGL